MKVFFAGICLFFSTLFSCQQKGACVSAGKYKEQCWQILGRYAVFYSSGTCKMSLCL